MMQLPACLRPALRHTFARLIAPGTALLLASPLSAAETSPTLRLPTLFTDHLVLQRDQPVPVWGHAAPGAQIRVRCRSLTAETTAAPDGRWRAELPPQPAGGPYQLEVADGQTTLTLNDILIGEVWVASGQSNMNWEVIRSKDPEAEIAAAVHPQIRLFTVPLTTSHSPLDDVPGQKWEVCSPDAVTSFSAVAYYFGRELQQDLHVPIGLINSSVGGTAAELWVSRDGLSAHPDFAAEIRSLEHDLVTTTSVNPWRVSCLFNGMIAPLTPYAVRGAIWYQGEANAPRAEQYQTLFPALILDWRRHWRTPEMPFLFVQLAGFMQPTPEPSDHDWARLREAQAMTLRLPATAMATAADIGEIHDIHPKNKQEVGRRLALAARAKVYGEPIVFSGPVFKSMESQDGALRLSFDSLGSGLAVGGGEKLKGFAVAGADKKFVWADARIEGETVIVSSPQIAEPAAVRYGWSSYPEGNLINREGLPAPPFRKE